jgi:hypothetical protein
MMYAILGLVFAATLLPGGAASAQGVSVEIETWANGTERSNIRRERRLVVRERRTIVSVRPRVRIWAEPTPSGPVEAYWFPANVRPWHVRQTVVIESEHDSVVRARN